MSSEANFIQYPYGLTEKPTCCDVLEKKPTSKIQSAKLHASFSLVIPAYNEEKRIRPFLEHIESELPLEWEIIIVADGDDRTADIAKSFGNRFTVYEYGHKLGKGGAILEGFKKANGEVIGYVDADGALKASEILRVFNGVNNDSPVAIGSRWVNGSRILTKQPVLRVILGRLYHYVTFAFLGIKQKDTQCGLKAYRKELIHEIIGKLTLTNLSIDTAIIYHCKLLNQKILEVPVSWQDIGGSKFHPLKSAIVMFGTVVGLRIVHGVKSQRIRKKISELHEIVKTI